MCVVQFIIHTSNPIRKSFYYELIMIETNLLHIFRLYYEKYNTSYIYVYNTFHALIYQCFQFVHIIGEIVL